jgi:hypothetical protein
MKPDASIATERIRQQTGERWKKVGKGGHRDKTLIG